MNGRTFSLRLAVMACALAAALSTPAVALTGVATTSTSGETVASATVADAADGQTAADATEVTGSTAATTDAGAEAAGTDADGTAAKATEGTIADATPTGGATALTDVTDASQGASAAGVSTAATATNVDASTALTSATESAATTNVDPQSTPGLQAGSYTFVLQTSVNDSRAVVDIAGGSKESGGNAQAYESNGTDAQRWIVLMDSNGYCRIKNAGSGLFLDVSGGVAANGTNVWQYSSNTTNAQIWYLDWVDRSAGVARFLSAIDTRFALDLSGGATGNGTNVQLWTANGTPAQNWILRNASKDASSGTTSIQAPSSGNASLPTSASDSQGYVFHNTSGSCVIAVDDASSGDGATAEAPSETGMASQAFKVTETSNGYYRIENMVSGMSLSANAWDVVPGAKVMQRATSATDLNQLWVARLSNGKVVLVSAATGLALNAFGGVLACEDIDGSLQQEWSADAWKAAIPDGCYYMGSGVGNAQTLDVSGGSWDGAANVQIWDSNQTGAQRWAISWDTTRSAYSIRNVNSGLYLTATGNNAVQAPDGGTSSRWTSSFLFGKGYVLTNLQRGWVLDVVGASSQAGTNVQIYPLNSTKAQAWILTSCSYLDDGIYQIAPGTNSGLRLDVSGGSASDGANVQVWNANGSDAQLWRVVAVGGDWYRITSAASGKSLDVSGASTTIGTNVQQWTSNGTEAQRWKVVLGDHGIQLVSGCGGNHLDVSGGSALSGANVQVWSANSTAAQAWHFISGGSGMTAAIDSFVRNLEAIANDNSHGYDQTNRWGPDYDCSSYVITCLKNAGFDVGDAWYTGNMKDALVANGWEWITDISNTVFEPGDILLNEASHVGAMINNTEIAEAESNEFGGVTGGATGDQTGSEILVHIFNVNYGGSFDGILRCTSRSKLA